MKHALAVAAGLGLLLAPMRVARAGPEPQARWVPATTTTGKPVVLQVEVPLGETDADVRFSPDWRVPGSELLGFDAEVREQGGARTWRARWRLLPLAPGTLAPPPLPLHVVRADGSVERRELALPTLTVTALTDEDAKPLGPSPPRALERPDPRPLLALLGAVLALLAGGWLWRRLTRRRVSASAVPSEAARPRPSPEAEALARLATLQRDLPAAFADGRADEWVDRLSDVVRAYLGRRYGLAALELTTGELLQRLAPRLDAAALGTLQDLLQWADRIKFAGAAAGQAEAADALERSRQLVERLRPRAPAPVEGGSSS